MNTQAQAVASSGLVNVALQSLRLKRILVPVDFSPASKNALNFATKLAQQCGAELTLIHVLDPMPAKAADFRKVSAFAMEQLDRAEQDLCELVHLATEEGVHCAEPTFRVGLATHEIVEAAKELHVDLIVIATHGYTGWKHFCIGSTAERVVRAAPCSVFVVREKEHDFV